MELPCTDPTKPKFELRDDIDIVELGKYFSTQGIKLMGAKDKEGRPVKVWSYRDRPHFKEFLFCAVGTRKTQNMTKRTTPVCPETQCGVLMDYGVDVVDKSALFSMLSEKAGTGLIKSYCTTMGITSPWEVEPESYIISKEMKKKMDTANSVAWTSLAGSSTLSSTAFNLPSGNPTAGSSEIKSVEDKLAALERRIEALQAPSTGGRSLDEIFSKLEALEARVAKVDELSVKMDKTTAILDALCAKIGLA